MGRSERGIVAPPPVGFNAIAGEDESAADGEEVPVAFTMPDSGIDGFAPAIVEEDLGAFVATGRGG
jgi:hypothetical protein